MSDRRWVEVTCNAPQCRNWAVAYTTRAENPEPWPRKACSMTGCDHPVMPLWYACRAHSGAAHHALVELLEGQPAPVCERCGATEGIEWVDSGSMYHEKVSVWQWIKYGPQGPPSANRSSPYCPECAADYRAYNDERWAELRSSAGV